MTGFGGGLYVPTPDGRVGPSVTLTRVWVHGNRATATRTSSSPSGVLCPHSDCPFAFGAGGGIFNAGRMTIIDSRVEHNVVDGRLSDADGGGIYSQLGSLSLVSSTVSDNHARPKSIGRFAEVVVSSSTPAACWSATRRLPATAPSWSRRGRFGGRAR